jgi:hypothetical protein
MWVFLSLSLSPVTPTLEHRASVKRFVSLQFLNPKTVGRTPWMRDQPVLRPLPIQTQNKHKQTSMLGVGFEPTIPAFERAKTVHALDSASTVTGWMWGSCSYLLFSEISLPDVKGRKYFHCCGFIFSCRWGDIQCKMCRSEFLYSYVRTWP